MRYPIATLLCLTNLAVHANVLQYFSGISYSNPAELFKVKSNEFILGGTGFYADVGFRGSVLNLNTFQYDYGSSSSQRISFLPFGRIATRVNEKLVVGVDVTQPFHSNLIYGARSITRYASTETLMTDVDISPRFAYSLNQKLYMGAGLNLNFLKDNQANWALPINQTDYSTLINRSSSFGVGYDAGLYFMLNKTNFLGITYYSLIKQNSRGESIFYNLVNDAYQFKFKMPATTVANFVHIFNPKWLASFQVFCTEWNANQYARLQNTAAPPPVGPNFTFTMKYSPSMAYAAVIHHQYKDYMGFSFIAVSDDGPERDYLRTLNFPSDTQYFFALSTDYHLSKTTSVEILYGYVFSNTNIQNHLTLNGQNIPFTTGKVRINGDVVDVRLKIQA